MNIISDPNSSYRCSIECTLEAIGGKWKPIILWSLVEKDVRRYGEIKRYTHGITHKMLSQELKDLELKGIIHREQYNQVPPKVEYWLTDKGKSLIPILKAMCQWGNDNMND